MFKFQAWLDSWNSPGGRDFMLFILVLVGIWMVYARLDYGKEFLAGFVGALLMNLRSDNKQGG